MIRGSQSESPGGATTPSADLRSVIEEISERLFSLFVVNDRSLAFQLEDGTYRRRDVPITPFLIRAMVESGGSFGCYQQKYMGDGIRWICFDYDCVNKECPDIAGLLQDVIDPLCGILDGLGIRYLREFSGRRGVHVWVVFSEMISKDEGYRVLVEIERRLEDAIGGLDATRWHIDRFPATASSKGNIVGKQVKMPLSTHRAGGMSRFLVGDGDMGLPADAGSFFQAQLEVLRAYEENDPAEVMETLGLSRGSELPRKRLIRRFAVVEGVDVSADELIGALSGAAVYRLMFERLRRGSSDYRDRSVLFGTLSAFSNGAALLREVLRRFPNFDEDKTDGGIAKLRGRYHPASFGYLYRLYGESPEPGIDLGQTGFEYALKALGIDVPQLVEPTVLTEVSGAADTASVVAKEKKYLADNDEATDVRILLDLELMNSGEYRAISAEVNGIVRGDTSVKPPSGYRVFRRLEGNGKARELVSLSAHDRVLTTELALIMCSRMHLGWHSFSYHVDLMSQDDIFAQWFPSWTEFVGRVRQVLDTPFFADYEAFAIDLQGFYGNVDFLGVYPRVVDSLPDDESTNAFRYLMGFNDALMTDLHGSNRRGVPQGPAYARIIAEMHLDEVMSPWLDESCPAGLHWYRYVDDMVFFCEPGFDGLRLFEGICRHLANHGLPVNKDKSSYLGKVGSMSESERALLAHADSFSYELHEAKGSQHLVGRERRAQLRAYLDAHEFDIDALGFLFGDSSFPEVKEQCFRERRGEILASEVGRGRHFKMFYQYAFSDVRRITEVLSDGGFSLIPVGSVNFSNFIDELYLACRGAGPNIRGLLEGVAHNFLPTIDVSHLHEDDLRTVEALLSISGGA